MTESAKTTLRHNPQPFAGMVCAIALSVFAFVSRNEATRIEV